MCSVILPGFSSRLVCLIKLIRRRREWRALVEFKMVGKSGLSSGACSSMESMALRSFLTETSPIPDRTLLQMRVRLTLSR